MTGAVSPGEWSPVSVEIDLRAGIMGYTAERTVPIFREINYADFF
jgi:hypothetical protein